MSKRILVVLPRDLPGVVLSEPALRALRKNVPQYPLVALVPRELVPLAKASEHIEFVESGHPASIFFFFTLLRYRPHRVIFFTSSWWGALWSFLAGVPKRVGFRSIFNKILINRRVRPMPKKLKPFRVRHFVELVRYFGCQVDDRLPSWGQAGKSEGPRYLITSNRHEALPQKIVSDWTGLEPPFTPLPTSLKADELMTRLQEASLVAGLPDSPLTLASALNLPVIRLLGRKPSGDQLPTEDEVRAQAFEISYQTSAQDALEEYTRQRA